MNKEIARDIVLVIIVIAGLLSFFYNPLSADMKYLQILMGAIIGFYTGIQSIPVMGAIKKGKK